MDTETGLIREALLAPALACISYSDGEYADIIHGNDPAAYRCARWLLEQEHTTANGPYDWAVLWAKFPELQELIWEGLFGNKYHDVQTRQKLMDIGAGCYRRVYRRLPGAEKVTLLRYSLSDLHARYYGVHMEKDEWRLRYGELTPYPLVEWPAGAITYAKYDAIVTSRIHKLQDVAALDQIKNGVAKHNLWDESPQVRAHFALHLMACWGFKADKKQVEKVIGVIDDEQPPLARNLRAADLVRAKGGKDAVRNEKLAKARMYAAVGDAGELTDTGYKKVKAGEMTKDQALRAGYIKIDDEWCEVSKDPLLMDYNKFRQNQLLRSKLEHIRTAAIYGLPVQTSFEVLMETGRTSSSENKLIRNSMALQNPPRKGGMRECFIARDGMTLIAADFGQAELVSLSQVTYSAFGFSKMKDLLNARMDIHVDFAKDIMGHQQNRVVTYEEGYKLHKLKDALFKELRNLAKGFNFGKPGGLGAASFQSFVRKVYGVEITFEESKQFGARWLRHFPEMKEYFRWMSQLMENGGGKADIQQFMSGRWRGKCFYTQGCNTLFQGLTADAAKAALVMVSYLCYSKKSSPLYGCRPNLFVHDEILLEAPREQAAEAAKELERVMVEEYRKYTPDVLITVDAHLMDRWSKDAEATFDERGKLIPWNPPQDEDEKLEWSEMLMAA